MGTRNLTIVQLDGEYKVAQYGQWDGYPGGQGKTVFEFLSSHLYGPLELFKEKVRAAKFIDAEQLKRYYRECGADDKSELVSMEIAHEFGRRFPQLYRDTGAGVLDLIFKAPPGIELRNEINFAADSLFCEWAYVIDLDKSVLEVYKGFVTDPKSLKEGRFKDLEYEVKSRGDEQYYPVTLLCSFPFDSFPNTAEEFIESCEDHVRARAWAEWDQQEKLTWLRGELKPDLFNVAWGALPLAIREAFAER